VYPLTQCSYQITPPSEAANSPARSCWSVDSNSPQRHQVATFRSPRQAPATDTHTTQEEPLAVAAPPEASRDRLSKTNIPRKRKRSIDQRQVLMVETRSKVPRPTLYTREETHLTILFPRVKKSMERCPKEGKLSVVSRDLTYLLSKLPSETN